MRNTLRFATYALVTSAAFVSFSGHALAAQAGTLSWSLDPDTLMLLDGGRATVSPSQQASFVETFGENQSRTELTVGFNAVLEPGISNLQSATSQGSITFTMPGPRSGFKGGAVTFSNFRLDASQNVLFVDAVGTPLEGSGFTEQGFRLALLEKLQTANGNVMFDAVSGDETFGRLVGRAFGSPGTGSLGFLYSIGTITVAAVPEPSTYMMFLLGIAGLLAAKRRR